MCGIAGHYRPSGGVSQEMLQRAADALTHRGPDGKGFYLSPETLCGLAHRRLSIIDLQTGAQPISNEDGSITAAVNGEFYGHAELRETLRGKGHVFKTSSDSEILLHLYEEHGTDCLSFLRGEFAFLLWDGKERRLFAARDRFGIKPLCYAETAQGLLLASEAKAIFAMGHAARWDAESFAHAAALQYTPGDATLFDGVRQLPPGCALLAGEDGFKVFRYWDIDFAKEAEAEAAGAAQSDDDAAAQVLDALKDSIRQRLVADVPVCCHLSGGLDSSAILGIATHLAGRAPDAFTVGFDHEGYDETALARESAAACGARLHVVQVRQEDLVREMPAAVFHGEGLAINGHLVGKYMLNRAIRAAGFKVALSGEGSDEMLSGYPHFRQDLMRHADGGDEAALYARNAALAGVQIADGAQLPTGALRDVLGFVPAFLEAKASMGYRLSGVLTAAMREKLQSTDYYGQMAQSLDVENRLRGRHPVNQSAYIWSKLALANYILRTLGDGMEMAHGVEGRLPFLDHNFFAAVRKLPLRRKIRDMTEKFILREAAKPFVTDAVYRRQKQPFMAPPLCRFRDDAMTVFIRDQLASRSFREMPFFDQPSALRLLDDLPNLPVQAQTAAEPVLMTMLTAHLLQQTLGLSA